MLARGRRQVRQRLRVESVADVLPILRELSDVWTMAKDGKRSYDTRRHPWLRRK
jgi:hypothetical protein